MTTEPDSDEHLVALLVASDGFTTFTAGDGYPGIKADTDLMRAAAARIRELHYWKQSAIEILNEWDKVWEAAGCPGPLGGSKATNVLRTLTEDEDPTL